MGAGAGSSRRCSVWLAACLLVPGTAAAVDSSDGVATDVFRNGTEIDVYYQSADSALRESVYSDAGGWSGPISLGGAVTPPSSGPSVTTPVPTVILPAPSGRHSRPHVRVKLVIRWTWNRRGTRMISAKAFKFPKRARLAVRCSARGCPPGVTRATRKGLGGLWRRLERPLYRSGDRLTLTITQPGHVPERAQLTFRRGKVPAVRLL